MRFTVTSTNLTGTPGSGSWVRVHEFTPEGEEEAKTRGSLAVVFGARVKEEGVEAVSIKRDFLSELHAGYYGKKEGSAYNILVSAVENVFSKYSVLWSNFEIAAVSVVGNVVYSAAVGGGEASILRRGALAKILESGSSAYGVVSASGYPKENDTLILGTKAYPKAASLEFAADTRPEDENIKALPLETVFAPKPKVSGRLMGILAGLTARLPERKIYVANTEADSESVRSKKTTMTIGAILLFLLLTSIIFGVRQNGEKVRKAQYEGKLKEAQHQFEESINLAALDPGRSRELFGSSREIVQELIGRKISDTGLNELAKRIKESEGKIMGVYTAEPEVFMDLSLFSQGFKGEGMAGSQDTVFVFDKTNKKIISVTLASKRGEIVAGPDELADAQGIAAYEDRVFTVSDSGIFEVGDAKKKVADKFWPGETALYAYTGNIYLLDKGGSMIWRINGAAGGFGTPQKWLGPGVSPNFGSVASWTIDGSVWTLDVGGKVRRFSLGKQDDLGASGVSPNMTSAQSIYGSDETKYVYILDKENRRVVVLDKDGNFYAQYSSDKIGEAESLVASEKVGKILLLAGSKLYSLDMKHL